MNAHPSVPYPTPQPFPSVTVVTVCYQAARQLEKTIGSVAQQRYDNLEYIVADGGSTDDTLSTLRRHESLISRWVSEPDKGIYDAMNKATAMATGTWVIFLNAGDCFADTDVLQRIFSAAPSEISTTGSAPVASPRDADIIYGDVVKGGTVKKAEPWHNAHRMIFCHQSSLVRRECLLENPFDISHPMSADFKQFKLFGKAGKVFCQVPFPIADFDVTGVSNTRRSAGLMDNIRVVREVDTAVEQLRLLPKLLFTWAVCKLRGK